nr:phage portal protein [uncultured Roseateles sp.]
MTDWHDLSRAPMRPSRVLSSFVGPAAKRAAAVQQDRVTQQRAYAGASMNRLNSDWTAYNTSADSELLTGGRVLRARSRELVRDNEYALHCVRLLQNNVIGNGIGLQAQVKTAGGKLLTKINDSIEQAYADWSVKDSCHVAGLLGWAEIERVCVAELVTSGEVIVRLIRQPFGRSNEIPLAIELIEADRLLDNWQTARAPNGNAIRMGVEIDQWHRPVAYWFSPQHPGDYQFKTFEPSRFMRVPAEDIIHLYIINRWPQTRGEPWFHATLRTMNDTGGFEEAEIVKARASANVVGFISSPEPLTPDAVVGGRQLIDTEPGTWQRLLPGESVAGFNATSPNPAVEGFLRHMVRKMGVGVGLSYEAISRDLTSASYSSGRMGMLDDRDLYRVLQGFVIRNLRVRVHTEFMDAATLVAKAKTGADYYSNPGKYRVARFKPRGWSWIDPGKEVNAFKAAVRAGFMTAGDVIAQSNDGQDVEDVWKTRAEEIELAAELGLVLDTDPAQVNDKGQVQAPANGVGAEGSPGEPGENDDGSDGTVAGETE